MWCSMKKILWETPLLPVSCQRPIRYPLTSCVLSKTCQLPVGDCRALFHDFYLPDIFTHDPQHMRDFCHCMLKILKFGEIFTCHFSGITRVISWLGGRLGKVESRPHLLLKRIKQEDMEVWRKQWMWIKTKYKQDLEIHKKDTEILDKGTGELIDRKTESRSRLVTKKMKMKRSLKFVWRYDEGICQQILEYYDMAKLDVIRWINDIINR